jgi:hypothetical protein
VWEVEEIAPSAVHLFVRRGSSGAAKTEIPNSYFTTIYKKFEVRDGVIHQMLTSPAGVEFTSRRLAQ